MVDALVIMIDLNKVNLDSSIFIIEFENMITFGCLYAV